MSDDDKRLAALKQGVSRSSDVSFVAIQVGDLRWLLDLVESLRQPQDVTNLSPVENN